MCNIECVGCATELRARAREVALHEEVVKDQYKVFSAVWAVCVSARRQSHVDNIAKTVTIQKL